MSQFTTRPDLQGTFGAVSATHWLASAVGMSLLERGCNAFDAAVAAGFTLQIVEPHLNGPGGEVPIIVTPAGQPPMVICGQGPSPAAATLERFRALGLDLVPGTGLLPACVPGAFGAWLTLLRDHGTAELEEVLAPAIHYAEHGHPIVPRIANTIASLRELFERHWTHSASIYLPDGRAPQAGQLLRNPEVAALYRDILDAARGAPTRAARIEAALAYWYEGPVAARIGDYCATETVWDVSGAAHRGLLTADDMAGWRPGVEAPVSTRYGEYEVFKCAAWSQGPVLLQALNLLSGTAIDRCDPLGPDFVHLITEATKLAMADRDAWYGDDPGVPLAGLLRADYTDARRRLIGEVASQVIQPGAPDGRTPSFPPQRPFGTVPQPGLGGGEPTVAKDSTPPTGKDGEPALNAAGAQRGDTVQVSAVDRWGNMVSATPSGGWFQSSPVIPGLGFSLTTRGQMFWLQDGLASTMRPGVRPRTTLTPSTVFRDGKAWLAFGTPGGDQQDQWQLQFLLRLFHAGYSIQQSIDAPAFHTDHLPSSFWPREVGLGSLTVEPRFGEATIAALRARGHKLTVADPWSEGRLSVVGRRMEGSSPVVFAGANPRGMQGYAIAR